MRQGVFNPLILLAALATLAVACRGPGHGSPAERPTPPWEAARVPGEAGRWRADRLVALDAAGLLAEAPPGRIVVVALWATWCEPCIAEMPELQAFAAAHPDVLVLGLATDPPGAAPLIQTVLDRVRPTYPQALLEGGEGALLARVSLEWDGILPKTLVIRDGAALRAPLEAPVTRASIEAALAPYRAR